MFWRGVVPTEAFFTPLHSGEGKTCPRAHPEVKPWWVADWLTLKLEGKVAKNVCLFGIFDNFKPINSK